MKKNFLLISLTIIAFSSIVLLLISSREIDKDIYKNAFKDSYKIYSPNIPDNISFANEAVPIDIFYVRESLERELLVNVYWNSNTLLLLKRAFRFFPIIEPILKKNNIHNDFKYVALIESGLSNVVSPAGASGFWQFIKPTALRYGMEINDEVDERYNLEKSTEAACKYFKKCDSMFKNNTLSAAAFNMGEDGIRLQLMNQKVKSYYELYLNQETSRYIYRILSLKLIYENPVKYGYYLRYSDLYPPIPSIRFSVDTSITNLISFAKDLGYNYKILKEFNPWLREKKLSNPKAKRYEIIFPKKECISYKELGSVYLLLSIYMS